GTLSYTWAHNIDNASEVFSTTAAGLLSAPQNPFDVSRGERANSNYDYRHTVGLTMVYEMPFFRGEHGFLGKILGGWQPDLSYRYSTGQPYNELETQAIAFGNANTTPTGGVAQLPSLCDPSGYFSTSTDACRPILSNPAAPLNTVGVYYTPVGGATALFNASSCSTTSGVCTSPVSNSSVHWIVNNSLAAKVLGTPFGGMARNSLNGQPIHAMNFAMSKNTKINERMSFQLRATAFNVMNHQYLGIPGNSLASITGLTSTPTLGSTVRNTNGNGVAASIENGLSRRRLEIGGKFIF
ncbi:MAG TPA: hypothetical protein VFI82_07305, partial [Terriglobales bacterium]|nr:hypothetical protein [Terriglobales bacterium]